MADEIIQQPASDAASDAASDYLEHRNAMETNAGASEFSDWLKAQAGETEPSKQLPGLEGVALEPFPTRRPPAEPSTVGTILRSGAEIGRQTVGGIDDAARHALQFLNPLTDWLDKNVADLKYEPVDAPKTTTGRITRSLSEFLTGFIPALRGLRAVGMAGKVIAPNAAAVISDFAVRDPSEARLSNLWNELGMPKNDLTDYLAADPKDTEMEGRFKSAIEASGLGLASEGVFLAARFIKSARKVARINKTETELLKGKYGEITDETFNKILGDPSLPAIQTVVTKPPAVVAKIKGALKATENTTPEALVGGRAIVDAGESSVYINFSRFNSPDDVKGAIAEMANKFKGTIDEARRGKITQVETEKMADEMGMTVAQLMERRRGQPFNAEEAVAARKLWAASGEKLLESARQAASPNASPIDQFTFRKMMATHFAIQSEVIGARTETARSLAAWKIPVGGGIEKARAIEQIMTAMGGPVATQEMARRLAILFEFGAKPEVIRKFAEKGVFASSIDAVREVWTSGLLTSPSTHFVNAGSNFSVLMQQIAERRIAQELGGEVVPGEAMAMAHGVISSFKDALRLGLRAFRTGATGQWANKVDLPFQQATSSEAFHMASDTALGRSIDMIGSAAQIPFRLLSGVDEFYKVLGYRAEVHAQSVRMATKEGLKGPEFGRRVKELIDNPPENLKINAADAALYNTFTDKAGDVAGALLKIRNSGSPLRQLAASIVMPFVKTPSRIINYAFERSPLAPLMSNWRADLAAGGARADLAMTRAAAGTMIMGVAFDYADSGLITGYGPRDKAERAAWLRQGFQPYSGRVGNTWVSYNRADPLGMTIGFAADIATIVHRSEIGAKDLNEVEEVAAASIAAISQVIINKNYLQGLSNLVETLSDPVRYGPQNLHQVGASFLPATALVGGIERAIDPTQREVNSLSDAVNSRILGLSSKLTPKRTLWGEPIVVESGLGKLYDFLSPFRVVEIKPTPIDTEIMRLAVSPSRGEASAPSRINKETGFGGVRVDFHDFPKAYDDYVRLAGNDLKHPAWGMGAKDYLNAVVTGKHPMSKVYQIRSDELKASFISQTVSQYRALAQQAIMADPKHQAFTDHVNFLKADQQERRMPVTP